MRVLKFFGFRLYNRFDVVWLIVSGYLLAKEEWVIWLFVFLTAPFISGAIEYALTQSEITDLHQEAEK